MTPENLRDILGKLVEGTGRVQILRDTYDADRLPPKGQNSQAKGPFPDSTLESVRTGSTTDEAIRAAGNRQP